MKTSLYFRHSLFPRPFKSILILSLFFLSVFTSSYSSLASSSSTKSSNTDAADLKLDFSTFLGGNNSDGGSSIAVDSQGNTYITGTTTSSNFPTKNAFQAAYGGGADGFVAKFNSSGKLVFSTYFGGSGDDQGIGIAVDSQGNSYVTGSTQSSNFPTKNAYNATYGGGNFIGDAFVAKFNSSGKLVFSTFLGGSGDDSGNGIAVDAQGNCYVIGSTNSANFPTKNAYNSTFSGYDAFVTKFDSTGSLVFSTFLGGNNSDVGDGIAVDSQGNSYVTGSTNSANFPTKNAYNSTLGGYSNAFVAKFDSTGNLVFSTFLGGNNSDVGDGIAVDSQGNSYVTGFTSSPNFPTKNAFQSTIGSRSSDVFVTKLNSIGNLVFSTFLGGNNSDAGFDIATDSQDNIYVTGSTQSSNFPTKNAYNSTLRSGAVFVVKFSFSTNLSSNASQIPLSTALINLIFSSTIVYYAILPGILIISIVTLVEFRKYSSFKQQFNNNSFPSFYKFLVSKFFRHNKKSLVPNHISDKAFEILDEIEKENLPKE